MIRSHWKPQEELQLQGIWISVHECSKRTRFTKEGRITMTWRRMTGLTLKVKILWRHDQIKPQAKNFQKEVAWDVAIESKPNKSCMKVNKALNNSSWIKHQTESWWRAWWSEFRKHQVKKDNLEREPHETQNPAKERNLINWLLKGMEGEERASWESNWSLRYKYVKIALAYLEKGIEEWS